MPYQCIIIGHSAVEQELLALLLRKEMSITVVGVFREAAEALGFLQQQTVDMALMDRDTLQQSDTVLLQALLPVVIWSCSSWRDPTTRFSEAGLGAIFLRKPLRPHLLNRALADAVDHLEQRAGTTPSAAHFPSLVK